MERNGQIMDPVMNAIPGDEAVPFGGEDEFQAAVLAFEKPELTVSAGASTVQERTAHQNHGTAFR